MVVCIGYGNMVEMLAFRCLYTVAFTRHLKNHRKYLAVIFIWRNSNSISAHLSSERKKYINAILLWCRMATWL